MVQLINVKQRSVKLNQSSSFPRSRFLEKLLLTFSVQEGGSRLFTQRNKKFTKYILRDNFF